MERWIDRFVSEGTRSVTDALNQRLALRGRKVRCGDAVGVLSGVSETGALLIQSGDSEHALISGSLDGDLRDRGASARVQLNVCEEIYENSKTRRCPRIYPTPEQWQPSSASTILESRCGRHSS